MRSNGFQPNANQTAGTTSGARGFWRGFLANMTNPKSDAYYASVFAAFLTPDMSVWVLVLLIAAMSLVWHVLIAISFSASRVQTRYISVSKYVDQLCGGVLIFLGLRLA
nr:LysE family transporter [Roseobacter sp. CCS2]